MPKYRKTALIEATQWFKPGDHPAVIEKYFGGVEPLYCIETLEGFLEVTSGSWIATGVDGEHWPIKPDIFAKTYELVEETN